MFDISIVILIIVIIILCLAVYNCFLCPSSTHGTGGNGSENRDRNGVSSIFTNAGRGISLGNTMGKNRLRQVLMQDPSSRIPTPTAGERLYSDDDYSLINRACTCNRSCSRNCSCSGNTRNTWQSDTMDTISEE